MIPLSRRLQLSWQSFAAHQDPEVNQAGNIAA
jgi:hypothetical protein